MADDEVWNVAFNAIHTHTMHRNAVANDVNRFVMSEKSNAILTLLQSNPIGPYYCAWNYPYAVKLMHKPNKR